MTPQQAVEELKRRGITVSEESVLEEKGTTFNEFKKGAESLLKGSAKGIVDILGGWGNLYDYLSKSKDPSAFSSVGIARGIRDLTGVDVMSIPGYRGAYEVGQAGAPAAALSAAGLPGLFGRTVPGVAAEFGVAGGTGALASTVAPESPLAQLALQSTPYAVRGGINMARGSLTTPVGTVPPELNDLLRVGRMTPGEATGSRVQLATESRTAAAPSIEAKGTQFRQAQAQDVESFLSSLFQRASTQATGAEDVVEKTVNAFNNYGKALSSKLRSDSAKDFASAKNSSGRIDTTPVLNAVSEQLARIPPETPGFEALKTSLNKIINEYFVPAQPAQITPSTILGPTGQPATVNVVPAVPAGVREISIDRLQKNLSAWGEAVYSGKADFGKGNIFEGVAPGQAKGVALSILRGFRDSLDQAINQGVPGADKLKTARDNFKANLARIEEYSERPITKAFDVERATDLTAEKALNRLVTATPSERKFLAQMLQNNPDGIVIFDTIRRQQFTDVLNKARSSAAGASADSPLFDVQTALRELTKKEGDFDFLFGTQKAGTPANINKDDAILALTFMRKILKNEGAGGLGGPGTGEIYSGVRGLGGTSQQANLGKELFATIRDIVATPNAFADVIFNPETVKKMAEAQRKGKVFKAVDLIQSLGASAAKFAPRVGPMVETSQPTDTTAPSAAEPSTQITPEDALRQLQMMGIDVGQ